MKLSYQEVKELIDGERDYQDRLWPNEEHSLLEYLVYMEDYITESLHLLSRFRPGNTASACIRKVAALGVSYLDSFVSEREYGYDPQDTEYVSHRGGTPTEFAAYIRNAIQTGIRLCDRRDYPGARHRLKEAVAMAICCMMQHGAPARELNASLRLRTAPEDMLRFGEKAAVIVPQKRKADPNCKTCGGSGEISIGGGCHGYDDEPCPTCSQA